MWFQASVAHAEPTCAVPVLPRPQQSAGLLVLHLPLVLSLVGEGVDALVAAGVAVRVVDDHVVRGDGQVHTQLVAGQAALGLGTQRRRRRRRLAARQVVESPECSAFAGTVRSICLDLLGAHCEDPPGKRQNFSLTPKTHTRLCWFGECKCPAPSLQQLCSFPG